MKKGFTFIELIIVVGIVGMLLPALFSIFFIVIQQNIKIYRLSEVKKEGDSALNVIENTLRTYATDVYSTSTMADGDRQCSSGVAPANAYDGADGDSFYLKDRNNNWFRFYLTSDKISSQSSILNGGAATGSVDLTSANVVISDFSISCSRSGSFSTPIITVDFTIGYDDESSRPEDTASMTYKTNIKMRSF
jgi:prepilin-type N-terminal cleavage/methylation domain-containing protein